MSLIALQSAVLPVSLYILFHPATTLPPSPAPTPSPSTAVAETCDSYVDVAGRTLCPAGFSPVDGGVPCGGIGAVCDDLSLIHI